MINLVLFNEVLFFILGFPDNSVGKYPPAMQETMVWFLVRKIRWRRDRLPIPVFLGFPYGSPGKESTCKAGDLGSMPGLGRSPGEGKGYPLQYSGLEIPWTTVPGVAKSQTWRSGFHFSLFWISWASEHLTQALYPSRNGFNIYIYTEYLFSLRIVNWRE